MNRFLRMFSVLSVVLLFALGACNGTTSEGAEDDDNADPIDSDGDGFSDEEELEFGSDPNDPDSGPAEVDPSDDDDQSSNDTDDNVSFVATQTFAEDPSDVCNDGATSVPCTGEFDTCEAGTVGDFPAIRCGEIVVRDGTELSYAVQLEAIVDGGIDLRWGCQAEPGPGTTSCIFDVSENGESLIGGACEYEGDLVDDALVLSSPVGLCTSLPDEVRDRITSTTDVNGVSTTAAAFLNPEDQPVIVRIGTNTPITTADLAILL